MLGQNRIRGLQGEQYCLKGNEPILLDEPQTVWVVQSGSLALFAIAVKHGIPQGRRRYLFSIGSGEAMFSTVPAPQGQLRQLLAVSVEETELFRVPKVEFEKLLADEEGEVVLVERWIHQLGAALSVSITAPAMPMLAEQIQYFSLASGQIFAPQRGSVSWVQIQQGHARWMGFEELLLDSASEIFPLGAGMWLQADDTLELEATLTTDIRELDILIKGIAQLQTYFLRCIDLLEQRNCSQQEQGLLRIR